MPPTWRDKPLLRDTLLTTSLEEVKSQMAILPCPIFPWWLSVSHPRVTSAYQREGANYIFVQRMGGNVAGYGMQTHPFHSQFFLPTGLISNSNLTIYRLLAYARLQAKRQIFFLFPGYVGGGRFEGIKAPDQSLRSGRVQFRDSNPGGLAPGPAL